MASAQKCGICQQKTTAKTTTAGQSSDPVTAARLYAEAARSATTLPERDHLTREAARLDAQLT
mgnify:CR=1 FL=1